METDAGEADTCLAESSSMRSWGTQWVWQVLALAPSPCPCSQTPPAVLSHPHTLLVQPPNKLTRGGRADVDGHPSGDGCRQWPCQAVEQSPAGTRAEGTSATHAAALLGMAEPKLRPTVGQPWVRDPQVLKCYCSSHNCRGSCLESQCSVSPQQLCFPRGQGLPGSGHRSPESV